MPTTAPPRLCAAPGCSEPVPSSRTRPRRYHSPACKRAADVTARRTLRAVDRPGSLVPWSPSWRGVFVDVDPATVRDVLVEDLEVQGIDGYTLLVMADTPDEAETAAATLEASSASRAERFLTLRPGVETEDAHPRYGARRPTRNPRASSPDAGPEERRVLADPQLRRVETLGREDGAGADAAARRRTHRLGEFPAPDGYSIHADDRLPVGEVTPHLPRLSRDVQDRVSSAFAADAQRVGSTVRALRRRVPYGVLGGHGGYCEQIRRTR